MQQPYRIAILGIGGVGGFLGAKLAAAYSSSADKEIIFIARGSHAQAIREQGLQLSTASGTITAHPHRVAAVTDPIGPVDLLLCCTKAYDLEESIRALSASITADTLVLPLLNGVDSTERLQALLPQAKVLQGCIYIVSKITGPGMVQQRGDVCNLHFGGDPSLAADMTRLAELLKDAGIHAIQETNIRERLWSKFAFISPIATYTSAHNISIGRILESEADATALKQLAQELLQLATVLEIPLPADTIEKNFQVMQQLPYEATSSMHADFAAHKATELETLTGYVIRQAAAHGIALAAYTEVYDLLKTRH